MAKFSKGDKVTWVQPMTIVPHPEGKTDRNGEVLPVFRDKTFTGTIISGVGINKFQVRPDGLNATPKGIDSYYDKNILESELTKIES